MKLVVKFLNDMKIETHNLEGEILDKSLKFNDRKLLNLFIQKIMFL